MKCLILLTLCGTFLIKKSFCQNDVNPDILSKKIRAFMEESLKHKQMQNHLDSLAHEDLLLTGDVLLDKLSASLEAKFYQMISSVRRLEQVVKTANVRKDYGHILCCILSSRFWAINLDPRFYQKVALYTVCEHNNPPFYNQLTRFSYKFRDSCIENLQTFSSIRWQYLGSERGTTTRYPAIETHNCRIYDNRYRPWYTQAVNPKSKHVVIVIDSSDKIHFSNFEVAKTAAKIVVETLNSYDKFTVIAFSDHVQTISYNNNSCFSTSLVQATKENIEKFSNFIDNLERHDQIPCHNESFGCFNPLSSGPPYFGKALNKAYDYMNSVDNATDEGKVILFLSEGNAMDSASSVLDIINTRNAELNNTVVLLTYGFGCSSNFDLLKQMANLTTNLIPETDRRIEAFSRICASDPNLDLWYHLNSFRNMFALDRNFLTHPVWTGPYLDAWGVGEVITASLPVIDTGNDLVEVVGVDITTEELFSELNVFKPNELSYWFLINEAGLVIHHPLRPTTVTNQSNLISATLLERDYEFMEIFESMKRGEDGKKTFVSSKFAPRGGVKDYGVDTFHILSTYHWKHIANTNFSMCLVLAVNDSQSTLAPQGPLPVGSFLYHQFLLIPVARKIQHCSHLNKFCAKDESSVFLAYQAFINPLSYPPSKFLSMDARRITHFMEGISNSNRFIKNGIRDEVVVTSFAESLWLDLNEMSLQLQEQVAWRYIATKNGVLRNYPGTPIPNNYDPTIRSWFKQASGKRDRYVITAPYIDAASGKAIITLSRVLFEGNSQRTHDPYSDDVFAVMGLDILQTQFYKIFQQLYPNCAKLQEYNCFLIDNAGFVIIADEYVASTTILTKQHLTERKPDIANALIKDGVLRPVSCSNVETGLLYQSYKISDNQTNYATTNTTNCLSFEMFPVAETNAFMIIEPRDLCRLNSEITCSCIADGNCTLNSHGCQFPFQTTSPQYNLCSNEYSYIDQDSPPCAVIEQMPLSDLHPFDLTALPPCYVVSFAQQLTTVEHKGTTSYRDLQSTEDYTTINKLDTQDQHDSFPLNPGFIAALGILALLVIVIVYLAISRNHCSKSRKIHRLSTRLRNNAVTNTQRSATSPVRAPSISSEFPVVVEEDVDSPPAYSHPSEMPPPYLGNT